MSRATGGARPWNESAGRVGQRHLPRPPTSALIDAPRQSNFRLRASFFVAIITTATTPDSHPDCRALLIQIVALHRSAFPCSTALACGTRRSHSLAPAWSYSSVTEEENMCHWLGIVDPTNPLLCGSRVS